MSRRRSIALLALLLTADLLIAQTPPGGDPFLVKPYLQLGNAPTIGATERLTLLWHTADQDANWVVQTKLSNSGPWASASTVAMTRVEVATIAPHRVYSATLTDLPAGKTVAYRVLKDGAVAFSASAKTRRAATQPYQFTVFGDCAAGTSMQRQIAYQTYLFNPDFVFITGDIVYNDGRISEYRSKYFPVYNSDTASASVGAPLIRSIPFLSAPGNHDILNSNLNSVPDGLAYFYYWSQPLNGPLTTIGDPNTPVLSGSSANQQAFLAAAGPNYPRMANYSFDYGNAHWTVLDADPYVDWENPALRAWVAQDLANARNSTWRFVGFHQPGFNSARTHFSEQQMRVLADVFEVGNVDLVFTGHVHNYQRSYPMQFTAQIGLNGKQRQASGLVNGTWVLDRSFDGATNTRPRSPIYLVTGAGEQSLYNPEQETDPASWQEFTYAFKSTRNSLTNVKVQGNTLSVQQVSATGEVLDSFTLTARTP